MPAGRTRITTLGDILGRQATGQDHGPRRRQRGGARPIHHPAGAAAPYRVVRVEQHPYAGPRRQVGQRPVRPARPRALITGHGTRVHKRRRLVAVQLRGAKRHAPHDVIDLARASRRRTRPTVSTSGADGAGHGLGLFQRDRSGAAGPEHHADRRRPRLHRPSRVIGPREAADLDQHDAASASSPASASPGSVAVMNRSPMRNAR